MAAEQLMRASYSTPLVINSIIALFAGLLLLLLENIDWVGERVSFIALTMIVAIYLWIEINRLRRVHSDHWLINPVVLCSVLTFLLSYSLTNFLYFLPRDTVAMLGIFPVVTTAMVKIMYLVLLAAVAMWLGYWSPIAARFSRHGVVVRFQRRFLPAANSVRPIAIPILLILSVGARLLAVKLGVFGYSSNYQRLTEAGNYTQYIGLATGLGKLALVIAALQYYALARKEYSRTWLIIVLTIEVIFGFLSGFKSAVAMPFVIVGLCRYLRIGILPKKWLIYTVLGLFIAYAVIEPFRAARQAQGTRIDTTITGIATRMIDAVSSSKAHSGESTPFILTISSRSNLSYIGSLGIEFADSHAELPVGSPDFLKNVLLAPLHAWIPRFIWKSKPKGDLGLWYNWVVRGRHTSSTSLAMGPVTYMYFAGGGLAIFSLFFILGILQRALMFLFTPATNIAGGVVFLGILTVVTQINSAVNGLIVTLFRELPMLLLLLPIIFPFRVRGLVIKSKPRPCPVVH